MRATDLQITINVYKNVVLNWEERYVVKQTDWWLWLILFIWFSRLDEYLCGCESWALHFSCTHIQHHHVYTVQLIWQFRIRFFLSVWYDSTVLDRIHALFLESLSFISTLLCVYCWKSRNKTKSHSYNNITLKYINNLIKQSLSKYKNSTEFLLIINFSQKKYNQIKNIIINWFKENASDLKHLRLTESQIKILSLVKLLSNHFKLHFESKSSEFIEHMMRFLIKHQFYNKKCSSKKCKSEHINSEKASISELTDLSSSHSTSERENTEMHISTMTVILSQLIIFEADSYFIHTVQITQSDSNNHSSVTVTDVTSHNVS